MLRTIARQITAGQPGTAQAAAGRDHAGPDAARQHPPTPLPGYQLVEVVVAAGSPAAGRKLGEVSWPRGGTPVSARRGRHLRPPDPQLTLAPGDRVSLLTLAPGGSPAQDPPSQLNPGRGMISAPFPTEEGMPEDV